MVEIPTAWFVGGFVAMLTGALSWAAWITKEGRDRAKESVAAAVATRDLAVEVGRLTTSVSGLTEKQTTLAVETTRLATTVDAIDERVREGFERNESDHVGITERIDEHEKEENPRLARIEAAVCQRPPLPSTGVESG